MRWAYLYTISAGSYSARPRIKYEPIITTPCNYCALNSILQPGLSKALKRKNFLKKCLSNVSKSTISQYDHPWLLFSHPRSNLLRGIFAQQFRSSAVFAVQRGRVITGKLAKMLQCGQRSTYNCSSLPLDLFLECKVSLLISSYPLAAAA